MERTGRREFLRRAMTAAAVAAAPTSLVSAAGKPPASAGKPNILLINLDDHKADTLGFLGN